MLAVGATLLGMPAAAQTTAPTPAVAQTVADHLRIEGDTAYTWREGERDVLVLEGPIRVTAGQTTMTASAATVWLNATADGVSAEIALLGDAVASTPEATRRGGQLFVRLAVRQGVALVAENRFATDAAQSRLYVAGSALREAVTGEVTPSVEEAPRAPRPMAAQRETLSFSAERIETRPVDGGGTALVLTGSVFVLRDDANGDLTEFQGERAVLFTTLQDLNELTELEGERAADVIESVYLEGDVRVRYTPNDVQPRVNRRVNRVSVEQSLEAERVFYDFTTGKAVLTEAVLRTTEPRQNLPVTLRAETIRQISRGEFEAEQAELSTSRFALPEYSINASRIYVRNEAATREGAPDRLRFNAENLSVRTLGVPFFYLPRTGGAFDKRAIPLEQFGVETSRNFGVGVLSRWGLFETFGSEPPRGVDASYRVDYFSERGPALGLDFSYEGGGINTAGDPTTYFGDITAYGTYDEGEDDLGRRRGRIEHDGDFRGMALFEHQHFFPSDWQLQLRLGGVSDETFLEEWFERQWREGLPTDFSAYAKRQQENEALTLLVQTPTTDFVTQSEQIAENFDTRRLPEAGYFRTAEGLGTNVTFYSENRVGVLEFVPSEADPATDLGFNRTDSDADIDPRYRGVPAEGFTGIDDDPVVRADLRQQFDFPFAAGSLKLVPYVVARVTGYSDNPDDDAIARLLGGVGFRASTAFVRQFDGVQNEIFDLNRLRHIIEPHLHAFASAVTDERDDAFIYDTEVDDYQSFQVLQLGVRQRWQTKRGAADRLRSVDFLTTDVSVDLFHDAEDYREPDGPFFSGISTNGFRGVMLQTRPENSIPRSSVNGDVLWRVSDTTVVLFDASHNLEENQLATAAVGFAAQRGERLSYFLGTRYIGEINSAILSLYGTYRVGDKYTLDGGVSVDLSNEESRTLDIGINRDFDRTVLGVRAYYDQVTDESGIRFTLFPKGLGYGIDTLDYQNASGRR